METFIEIIALWPSLSDFAADLGVPYGVAQQWRRRNSIPSHRWARLVSAAQERGLSDVTAEKLADLARRRVAA